MPYGNPWDDDGDDPFRPVSFRDYARSQPAPALPPTGAGPVRRTDSMEWGKGVMDTLRQFVFRVPERVVANVGNAADLFEQVGRAAIQSGSLNPSVVAPQAAINSVSPAVGGEGIVERFITNPIQEGLDKLAGGAPENTREAIAAMGGSVVGEGLSMLGGGAAAKAALGKDAVRAGAQAMGKLPGTVLPRTVRDVALATPYNVANALDEKDSMAAVLDSLGDVEGEGRTADVVRTLSGLGERANQSPTGRLGLEFGTDVVASGVVNALGPLARGARAGLEKVDEAAFGGASAPARRRAAEEAVALPEVRETVPEAPVRPPEEPTPTPGSAPVDGTDGGDALKTTALLATPAMMGALSDDERQNQGMMALMALAGGHALGKAGAFKGLKPVGDKLWDTVFVGGADKIRSAAEKVGGPGVSNLFFTNRALGPEYQGLKDASLRERSEWSMKAKELQDRVGQYGEAFNRLLSRGIDEGWDEEAFGRALTGEGLDPTDAKVIGDIHDTFESLGRLMVAQHWISQQAFDRHTGRYAPRLYKSGEGGVSRVEAEAPLRPDRGRALDRTRFRGSEPAEGRELLEDGAFRAATGMVQEGHLTAIGNFMEAVAGNDEWTNPAIRSLRARKLDIERQLADINRGDAEIIDVAGGALKEEAPDQMALQAELDKLTSQIRDEGIEAERKGFVLMGDDHRYGALRGQWVRPEVKQDIEGFLKAEGVVGKAVKWYEQNMLGPWKRAKTIYNPATHGRNLAGAQLLSYLGNGPMPFGSHFAKAVKAMKGKEGDLYRLAREQGLLDSSNVDALRVTAVGGESGGTLARAAEELKRPGAKMQAGLTFGVSAIPGLDDKLTRLYAGGDQIARVAHFDHAMKVRGMSVEEAAADAKRWVPTYDNLSHASKLWSTAGAPFWAYTAVALPRVAEGVVKHPIRFMTFGTLAYAFEKMFTPADVPDSIMPPEMRGAGAGLGLDKVGLGAVQEVANFMFPTRFALPTSDPNRRTYADLTYQFPYGDIAEGRGRDTGPLGALPSNFNPGQAGGPFIGQAKELLLNKVHFTGRPVTRLSDSPGEKLQGVADYLYKSNFPSLAPAIPGVTEGGYGFQKIRDSIMHRTEDGWEFGAPQPNYMGDTRDWYSAIPDALIGTKQRQIDLGTEMERRIRALDYERQDAMAAAREVFRDAGSTEGQKERARARAAEKIQRINEQIARIVADGRAAGITPGRN